MKLTQILQFNKLLDKNVGILFLTQSNQLQAFGFLRRERNKKYTEKIWTQSRCLRKILLFEQILHLNGACAQTERFLLRIFHWDFM